MKKLIWVVLLILLFTGCGQAPTLETIGNPCVAQEHVEPKQMMVELPEALAAPLIKSEENGTLYLCEGYTLTLQALDGGDLNTTIKACTGFEKDALTVIETAQNEFSRYDCVWTMAGEKADEVGRLAILDDGNYHYVLTAMAPSESSADVQEVWYEIFDSFTLDTDQ